jgi:hypothetical protein
VPHDFRHAAPMFDFATCLSGATVAPAVEEGWTAKPRKQTASTQRLVNWISMRRLRA